MTNNSITNIVKEKKGSIATSLITTQQQTLFHYILTTLLC